MCNFEFLQVIIAFFSKSVRPRNMKFSLQRVSIWVNIQKNFKFFGRKVSEKNAMLTCKISKLFIRRIVQLWIFASYHRIFLKKLCDRGTWNFFTYIFAYSIHMGYYTKKFQVPRSHSIGEKCDANFKLSSHFSRKLCDQGTWNFFCIEYPYWLIYKKNFKFLGRTVWEKNAIIIAICKLSLHFSRKLCDRGTWNFFLHRVFIWVNI